MLQIRVYIFLHTHLHVYVWAPDLRFAIQHDHQNANPLVNSLYVLPCKQKTITHFTGTVTNAILILIITHTKKSLSTVLFSCSTMINAVHTTWYNIRDIGNTLVIISLQNHYSQKAIILQSCFDNQMLQRKSNLTIRSTMLNWAIFHKRLLHQCFIIGIQQYVIYWPSEHVQVNLFNTLFES